MKECTMCHLKEPDWSKCIFADCPNGMNIKEEKNHGGKRANAGRKSQYKEETKTISFRVPKSLIEPITLYVKKELNKAKI